MATMISELYDALVSAGAEEGKAREAATAVADFARRAEELSQGQRRLEGKVEAGFSELRAELDTRFSAVDTRFAQVDTRFAELRAEMDTRFAELRAEMDTRFAQVDMRFSELRAEMNTRFAEQRADTGATETRITRWFIGILLAQFAGAIAILLRLATN